MSGLGVKAPSTYRTASAPPPGYIPGIGRGAVGFSTRSDVGSAGLTTDVATAAAAGRGIVIGAGRGVTAASGIAAVRKLAATASAGRGRGAAPASGADAAGSVDAPAKSANFDSVSGYSEALFADAPYDAEDADADRVYASVEATLSERGRKRREAAEAAATAASRLNNARIGDSFADLKPQLATLSEADWASIPDIGDRSLKFKKKAAEAATASMPVPEL